MAGPARVLDLDMDFFLTDVCALAAPGKRPSSAQARPWDEAAVRAFLEEKCGLSRKTRIPGRVFDTHDGALFLWKEQIEAGKLTAPFCVTHVDAHADLGIGKPGPAYVLETVLALPPDARGDIDRYRREEKLDEANYLLFALALRYVCALENVRNPRSRADMPTRISTDGTQRPPALRLASSLSQLLPQYDFHEPEVPYAAFDDWRDFRASAPYALASMAISPRYAPPEADFIAGVLREYIDEI